MKYDVIIVGAGPGGIFSAYELTKKNPSLKVAVFEKGYSLEKRKCPIDGDKVKSCINCKSCAIMAAQALFPMGNIILRMTLVGHFMSILEGKRQFR